MYKRLSLLWSVAVFLMVTYADYSNGSPPGFSMGFVAWVITLAPWILAALVRFVVCGVPRQR